MRVIFTCNALYVSQALIQNYSTVNSSELTLFTVLSLTNSNLEFIYFKREVEATERRNFQRIIQRFVMFFR